MLRDSSKLKIVTGPDLWNFMPLTHLFFHFCPSSDTKTVPTGLNKQSRDFDHTHLLSHPFCWRKTTRKHAETTQCAVWCNQKYTIGFNGFNVSSLLPHAYSFIDHPWKFLVYNQDNMNKLTFTTPDYSHFADYTREFRSPNLTYVVIYNDQLQSTFHACRLCSS